jgi:hypothetical protein
VKAGEFVPIGIAEHLAADRKVILILGIGMAEKRVEAFCSHHEPSRVPG